MSSESMLQIHSLLLKLAAFNLGILADPVFLIVIYSMFLYLEEYSSNISAVLSVEPSFYICI